MGPWRSMPLRKLWATKHFRKAIIRSRGSSRSFPLRKPLLNRPSKVHTHSDTTFRLGRRLGKRELLDGIFVARKLCFPGGNLLKLRM